MQCYDRRMKQPGPDHPITIAPVGEHIVVHYRGEVVADTRNALILEEANYPPVIYVPRADARLEHFRRSAHHTHCPYKGDASYFDLVAGSDAAPDAVWSYETPFPAMAGIREHLAFYPQHVTIERG